MVARGPILYLFFFLSWSFGTLAVIPPELLSGVSFTPAWVVAGIITVKVILEVGASTYLRAVFDLRRFGVLTLCTIYSLLSAVLMPRYFAGQVDIFVMKLTQTNGVPLPLGPTTANFTQSFYFILTNVTVINFYFLSGDGQKRRDLLVSFGWGAALTIATGFIDLMFSKAGLNGLLEPYRNAAYALMYDDSVGGTMKRVVGLMTEASSYGALCLSFLGPLALVPALNGSTPWGRWRVPLVLCLILMVYLSTSSGGYLGLASVVAVVLFSIFIDMTRWKARAWLGGYGVLVCATAAVGLLLFAPMLVDTLYHLVDTLVLSKTHSISYMQRSYWNSTAYNAFLGTHWIGAGLGSVRASSWLISLLANIGAPGTALLAIFMMQIIFERAADPQTAGLSRAAKLALVPSLFVVSLSGTSVAFGLGPAWLFGFAAALAWPPATMAREGSLAEEGKVGSDSPFEVSQSTPS